MSGETIGFLAWCVIFAGVAVLAWRYALCLNREREQIWRSQCRFDAEEAERKQRIARGDNLADGMLMGWGIKERDRSREYLE